MHSICPLHSVSRKLMTANTCKFMTFSFYEENIRYKQSFLYRMSQEEWSIF